LSNNALRLARQFAKLELQNKTFRIMTQFWRNSATSCIL
jgi:hypothetical protein